MIEGLISRNSKNIFSQNPLTFSLPCVTHLPVSEGVGAALFKIAALIIAAVLPGYAAAYNAAAPVTCGVAIEVPLYEP